MTFMTGGIFMLDDFKEYEKQRMEDGEIYPNRQQIHPEQREDYLSGQEIFPDDRIIHPTEYSVEPCSEIESQFNEFLLAGEHILWCGKGKNRSRARAYPIFFSIFWLGFSIFWTVLAVSGGGAMGLFGLPFIAIGVFLILQSLGITGVNKYAITNMRLLSITSKRFKSEYLDKIVDVRLYQTGKGKADIYFSIDCRGISNENYENSFGDGGSIVGIDNADSVYRLLKEQTDMAYRNNSRTY